MDVSDKEKLETEKTGDDSITYHHTPEMFSSDWQYNARPNFATSSSRGLTADGNNVGPSSSPAVSIAESFVPSTWDHHLPVSQSVGYNGLILQNIANSSSDYLSLARGGFSLESSGWDASMKGGGFLANVSTTILPHSISPFPADSAFIERAARFSCFNADNVGEMVNPFGINQSVVNLCGNQEAFAAVHAVKLASDGQPPKNEISDVALVSQTAPLMGEEGDKVDSERKNERFSAEAKQDDSDEAGAGGGGEEEPFLMNTCPGPGPTSSRKRKRSDEDTETNEQSQQQVGEAGGKESGSKSSPPVTNKNFGKNAKRMAQTSEQPEDYIHVRARRGQATNSHSLAERVRREKISERMKFLQDLVPGCSKVTGKAVMLDEIINYVQSLQRQVEFLSMKLATVNPRLDFNIESLLAKDPMHGARAGPSTMGFTPDMSMAYHMMHPPQQSFTQPDLAPPVTASSDALKNIASQLTGIGAGYKEPLSQIPNMWDDELHNVVQMGFNPAVSGTGTSNDEDTKGSLPAAGQMKVEI